MHDGSSYIAHSAKAVTLSDDLNRLVNEREQVRVVREAARARSTPAGRKRKSTLSTEGGWLLKQGEGSYELFKRRWFVLHGNILHYYKRPHDMEPLGTILVQSAAVDTGGDPRLSLSQRLSGGMRNSSALAERQFRIAPVNSSRRVYVLQASEPGERDAWVDELRYVAESRNVLHRPTAISTGALADGAVEQWTASGKPRGQLTGVPAYHSDLTFAERGRRSAFVTLRELRAGLKRVTSVPSFRDEISFWGGAAPAKPRYAKPLDPREKALHDCSDELLLREVQRRAYDRHMAATAA